MVDLLELAAARSVSPVKPAKKLPDLLAQPPGANSTAKCHLLGASQGPHKGLPRLAVKNLIVLPMVGVTFSRVNLRGDHSAKPASAMPIDVKAEPRLDAPDGASRANCR
jgi:hypothetical protein